MATVTGFESYEQAVAQHRWEVPERYNIAADVCDKHPADALAMIHEHHDGTVRRMSWGELQEMSNRFANNTDLPDEVVKWFASRGVTQEVLRRNRIGSKYDWPVLMSNSHPCQGHSSSFRPASRRRSPGRSDERWV